MNVHSLLAILTMLLSFNTDLTLAADSTISFVGFRLHSNLNFIGCQSQAICVSSKLECSRRCLEARNCASFWYNKPSCEICPSSESVTQMTFTSSRLYVKYQLQMVNFVTIAGVHTHGYLTSTLIPGSVLYMRAIPLVAGNFDIAFFIDSSNINFYFRAREDGYCVNKCVIYDRLVNGVWQYDMSNPVYTDVFAKDKRFEIHVLLKKNEAMFYADGTFLLSQSNPTQPITSVTQILVQGDLLVEELLV